MGTSHGVTLATKFKDNRTANAAFVPQRLFVLCLGEDGMTYSTEKFSPTSAYEVGQRLGYRSQAYQIAQILFPIFGPALENVTVTFCPVAEGGSSAAAAGVITPTAAQTEAAEYRIKAGGKLTVPFVIPVGATASSIVDLMVAAVAATYDFPMVATDATTSMDLDVAWTGTNTNEMSIEIVGPTNQSTFALTQPVGGLVNPTIDPALLQIGDNFETCILNPFEYNDTTILNALTVFGESRWAPAVHKPLFAVCGNTKATPATAYATSTARATDRVNAYAVAPGSKELPCLVAAKQLVALLNVAASKSPGRNYIKQPVPTLVPGTDAQQWDKTARDLAFDNGCSNITVTDNQVKLGDMITFYRPTGEQPPAYRKVVNIVKLQNVLYNLSLKFDAPEWAGAEMLPSGNISESPTSKDPEDAILAARLIAKSLERAAILADTVTTNKAVAANISGSDPDLLVLTVPVKLTGNSDKIDGTAEFGFYYPPAAA